MYIIRFGLRVVTIATLAAGEFQSATAKVFDEIFGISTEALKAELPPMVCLEALLFVLRFEPYAAVFRTEGCPDFSTFGKLHK